MGKILVAYLLSLFGYPVWTTPLDSTASPVAAVEGKASGTGAAPASDRVAGRQAVAPEAPASPSGAAAKTDGGSPGTRPAPAAPSAAATSSAQPAASPATTSASTAGAPSTSPPDGPLSAADVVARVQEVYDGTTSFQANFRQVFRHRLNPDRSKEASGVVYLQKPGKMRWEYHDPERKLIVSDGTTLWAYEPSEDQVFEQSLENTDLPTAVTFLLGSGSLSAEFDARLLEQGAETSADRYVIELRPRTPSSQYARLLLVVRRSDFHVVRTVVIDHSGNTNSIEFAGERLNEPIPAAQFRFVRPEGARVIR